ncbi:hypothetical protein DA075_34555 [Methylobacterium currus]|uniref:Hydroxyquinol 1,2-dioxygenase n=2 Tax=Methylobacterium TaxID=407 RepID=A0A2R4WWJ9_9HYPH|nr:hypothetical protein DA075_34555 [Methylobacterium currus]TGD95181.1 hypothetical protein EU555_29140 [Methylobacterium nonmethylotrophicum]
MNNFFAVVLALAAFVAPASANPHSGTRDPAAASILQARSAPGIGPQATGSLPNGSRSELDARGGLGRDMRSSTRDNAQFPERAPEAQNLGGTAGGPQY